MTTGSPSSTAPLPLGQAHFRFLQFPLDGSRSETFTVTLFLWLLLQFVGSLLKENKCPREAWGHRLVLQLISVVFLIVEASHMRWKRLSLLHFLSSGWQVSSVNKRTLSQFCAVNRICWSRLAAPCLSAEDGPGCRAPCTCPSFDKDEKL